jgi:tetratricopeptide (TPR) repeat protein
LEDLLILEAAQRANPDDGRAAYGLGNFCYAHRRYDEAADCWERATRHEPGFPTAWRNLGLACFNKRHDPQQALVCFEKAFALDPADARLFFELDQLTKRLNRAPAERLRLFERHPALATQRDDLALEHVTLLNLLERPDQAYQALMQHTFHPWEGGEGKVTGQYVTSLVEMARKLIAAGESRRALELLEQAQVYPDRLGEGKLYGAQENNIFYYLGCAYQRLGEAAQAQAWFERASQGLSEPHSALYYNDQPPESIFYQGLARQELGRGAEAQTIFKKLIAYGLAHLDDQVEIDYFAVSLPDFLVFDLDMTQRNRLHCHYMIGLGYLGLGELSRAQEQFEAALALDANHLGAALHRRLVFEEKQ